MRAITLAQFQVVIDQSPVQPLRQCLLDSHSGVGREVIARQQYHHHDHFPPRVWQYRHPYAAVAEGVYDRVEFLAQLVQGGAKQFFLGKAVEGRNQFLVVVRTREQTLLLQELAQLVAQDRNVLGLLDRGLGAEQANEAIETDGAALDIGAADQNVVHRLEPMDVGLKVALAHDQDRTIKKEVRIQRLDRIQGASIPLRRHLIAQNTKTKARFERQTLAAINPVDAVVLISEE